MNAVYTKKEEILFTIFSEEKKKRKKCETNRNKRKKNKQKIFMTNANKSRAAKLHFIRIFY